MKKKFFLTLFLFCLATILLIQNSYAAPIWWDAIFHVDEIEKEWKAIKEEYESNKNDNEKKKFMTELSEENRKKWLGIAKRYEKVVLNKQQQVATDPSMQYKLNELKAEGGYVSAFIKNLEDPERMPGNIEGADNTEETDDTGESENNSNIEEMMNYNFEGIKEYVLAHNGPGDATEEVKQKWIAVCDEEAKNVGARREEATRIKAMIKGTDPKDELETYNNGERRRRRRKRKNFCRS